MKRVIACILVASLWWFESASASSCIVEELLRSIGPLRNEHSLTVSAVVGLAELVFTNPSPVPLNRALLGINGQSMAPVETLSCSLPTYRRASEWNAYWTWYRHRIRSLVQRPRLHIRVMAPDWGVELLSPEQLVRWYTLTHEWQIRMESQVTPLLDLPTPSPSPNPSTLFPSMNPTPSPVAATSPPPTAPPHLVTRPPKQLVPQCQSLTDAMELCRHGKSERETRGVSQLDCARAGLRVCVFDARYRSLVCACRVA